MIVFDIRKKPSADFYIYGGYSFSTGLAAYGLVLTVSCQRKHLA